MTHQKTTLLILSLILVGLTRTAADPAQAQGVGANCPAVVASALQSVEGVCTGLGRNESCYGFNRVDALFWESREDLVFSAPSDRVPLIELRQIATAPLDVERNEWGVAALQLQSPDLPATLPGQAVMFLLMGDVSLENQVAPEEAALPVTPIEATTGSEADLFTTPTREANRMGALPAGTRVQAIGLSQDGLWAEILVQQSSRSWIERSTLLAESARALNNLPVTFGDNLPPRYGPMQAFYFSSGLAGPACNEAPDALVVQSPSGIEVALEINELQVEIGSTVAFTTVTQGDDSNVRVLIGIVFEGHMRILINGEWVELNQPGQTFAITLNEDGLVDEDSELLRLFANPLTELLQSACQNALGTSLLEESRGLTCTVEIAFFTPEEGFVSGLGFPGSLPSLGENNPPVNPQPIVPIVPPIIVPQNPVIVPPPLQWPQITRPASGATLVGGGSHLVEWTSTPGATGYQVEVLPDGTNQTGTFLSFGASGTSFNLPLDSLPSRPAPGWGYFLRVIPLDANGPMGAPDQAPAVWIVRQDPPPTNPPPPPTQEPTEEPVQEPTEESTEEPYEPYCYQVCDEIDGCYIVCEGYEQAY